MYTKWRQTSIAGGAVIKCPILHVLCVLDSSLPCALRQSGHRNAFRHSLIQRAAFFNPKCGLLACFSKIKMVAVCLIPIHIETLSNLTVANEYCCFSDIQLSFGEVRKSTNGSAKTSSIIGQWFTNFVIDLGHRCNNIITLIYHYQFHFTVNCILIYVCCCVL